MLPAMAGAADQTPVPLSDNQIGRVLAGRYRIEALLGRGGVGSVYRAEQVGLGRKVAVKVLLDEYAQLAELRKRFEREARTLSALSHPHIVGITDFGIADAVPFLCMELLEGKSLEQLIAEGTPAPARALDIVSQILEALAFAHAQGIVHRDLKPGNVFLQKVSTKRDHVKLLDFGLAKFLEPPDDGSHSATLTKTGAIFGTPAYMSPEQCVGSAADARADVYAVGIILFETLTGRRPFLGGTRSDLMKAHVLTPPPPLAQAKPGLQVAPELEALVQKALAKEPKDRFQDGGQMLAALERIPGVSLRESSAEVTTPPESPKAASIAPVVAPQRRSTIAETTPALPRTAPARRSRRPGPFGTFIRTLLVLLLAGGALGGVLWYVLRNTKELRPQDPAGRPVGPGGEASMPDEGEVPDVDDAPVTPQEAEDDTDISEDESSAAADDEGESLEAVAAPRAKASPRNPWGRGTPRALVSFKRRINAGAKLGPRNRRSIARWARAHRGDVRPHLMLAYAYMNLNYRSAAIERYRLAYRIDSGSRGDARMLRDLLTLVPNESSGPRAADAIVEIYGAEARDEVRARIARAGPNSNTRAAYERLLARL